MISGWVPELEWARGYSPAFEFVQWYEGLNVLMVDGVRGLWGGSRDYYKYAGSASNQQGARCEWQLDTTDGKTATFRIDDKEYDLSKGTLFVIKANSDKVQVHQLNRDLSALPFNSAAISDFLKNDPEVRKIFGVSDVEK